MKVRWPFPFLFSLSVALASSGGSVPFAVKITPPNYPVLAEQAKIAASAVLGVRI
jgi:hypothetical protein